MLSASSATPPASAPQPRSLLSLPEDIFRCIQEFTPIGALLDTSPRLRDVKRRLRYCNLSWELSHKYKRDEVFRELVRSSVCDPRRQIRLYLAAEDDGDEMEAEDNMDVSSLENVHTLVLSYCFMITDVSALGHVHTLDLSGCSGITDVYCLKPM